MKYFDTLQKIDSDLVGIFSKPWQWLHQFGKIFQGICKARYALKKCEAQLILWQIEAVEAEHLLLCRERSCAQPGLRLEAGAEV